MKNKFIVFAFIASVTACFGDFIVMFILGSFYPGYSQLRDSMSGLGATVSPVSFEMSAWWVIVGVLLAVFGVGFGLTFAKDNRARIAAWLIVIYGLGEGVGSGLFPADYIDNKLTFIGWVHDAIGGIGIAGIFFLPLVLLPFFKENGNLKLYKLSIFVFALGFLFLLLFGIARLDYFMNSFIASYKGLWQRLLMLNYYIFIIALAFYMLKNKSKSQV